MRKRVEEHYGKRVPEKACLLELEWCTNEIVVLYLTCERYGSQGCHVEDNRGQGVISRKRLELLNWCGYKGKGVEKAAQPRKAKAQQSSTWARDLEGIAQEEGSQKKVRRTFKMLREVWLNIGVKKLDTYEGVTIKALLDSGATGIFMDKEIVARHRFKLQKLERPIAIKNVDKTNNSGEVIIHQIEVNVYHKEHVERMRIDVCELGKIEIILEMP